MDKTVLKNKMKKYLSHIFIDGLSGMALGLFSTLIIGTILAQLGGLLPLVIGKYIIWLSSITKLLMGAGIGVGIAYKYKSSPLVVVSTGVAGMIGAFASVIINGSFLVDGGIFLKGVGEPLGAFIAAYAAVEIGNLIAGKTKVDIIITPALTILSGATIGLLAGPSISRFMYFLGDIINWSTEQQMILMSIIISALMGIALTLPISSAALGIMLNLSGAAAGAATIGCCAQMVGFAVASYRENKINGLIAQGLGTSMLQMPNIIKNPRIWIPPTLASMIIGPFATTLFGMTSNATGSGMGTSGLVGQFMTFDVMTEAGGDPFIVLLKILFLHFILPAALTLIFSELMRKRGWIKKGDMSLNV